MTVRPELLILVTSIRGLSRVMFSRPRTLTANTWRSLMTPLRGSKDIEVPDELRALHDEGIIANKDLSAINHGRLDRLADASSSEEVDEVFAEDPDFTDAVARTDTVCEEIQDRAAKYDIELDLDCEK